MYFYFQNMTALCDNNGEESKFWFSRSPCGDARYPVIATTDTCSNLNPLMLKNSYLNSNLSADINVIFAAVSQPAGPFDMHEIISLQFGQRSNYLATHFWNIQVQ
jgi:hypothetical protein